MSNEILDDYEQGERVKQWLTENGPAIGLGVVLGLGGLFSWRFWQDNQATQRAEAAAAYTQLVAGLGQDVQATTSQLQAFDQDYDSAAYEGLAALHLAGQAVEDKNLDEAAKLFRIASEKAEPAAIRHVAGMRLARVQLQLGLLDQALATLDRFDTEEFAAMSAQIRGDVLLAQGDRDAARESYQSALDNMDAGGGDRNLLQMKLDDLVIATPVAPPPGAEPGEASDGEMPAQSAPAPSDESTDDQSVPDPEETAQETTDMADESAQSDDSEAVSEGDGNS